MKLSKMIFLLVGAVCVLSGCGKTQQAEDIADTEVVHNEAEQVVESEIDVETEIEEVASDNSEYVHLQDVDWSGFKSVMTAEEYEALQQFLPVLTNEVSFTWIVGANTTILPSSVTLEEFEDINVESYYDEQWNFQLNSVKVCDLDANGAQELILEFRDLGWFSLILYCDEEVFYGLELGIRSFNGLQKNGVYIGSGGADWSYYYQLEFDNETFEKILLGHTEHDDELNDEIYFIGDEQVDEDVFWEWESTIMIGDVPEYKPIAKIDE